MTNEPKVCEFCGALPCCAAACFEASRSVGKEIRREAMETACKAVERWGREHPTLVPVAVTVAIQGEIQEAFGEP